MKPLFLEIQAFGPFVGKQTVDFEKLSKSGIFLIKGETGSGKTTIFDAMSFALYGCSTGDSRKGGRNDIEHWRCNQASEKDPTVVAFTFEANGEVYKFTRRYVMKRTNFSKEFGCVKILKNGDEIAVFTNPKESALNAKAEELVGLTHEQFCQVVLLPQGKFERFLTAPSDEKEEILSNIFNTKRWGRYADRFNEAAKARLKALQDENLEVVTRLSEEKLSSVEDLDELIKTKKLQLEELKEAHGAFNGAEKQKRLDADRELAGRFAELHRLEADRQKLINEKPFIVAKAEQHKRAEEAEELRKPIEDSKKKEADKNGRLTELNIHLGKLPNAKLAAEKAAAALADKKAASPVEKLNKQIGELEGKREIYGRIDGLKNAYRKAYGDYSAAKSAYDTAESGLEECKNAAARAYSEYNREEAGAKNLRDKYFAGIYGEIASELSEGSICPVCGSTHHPQPAEKADDSVSKAQMERGAQLAETAKKRWEDANKKHEAAKTAADECKKKSDAAKETATKAEAEYNSAKASLIAGIADSAALESIISGYKKEIEAFGKLIKKLEDDNSSAEKALTDLKSKIETANGELKKATEAAADAELALETALAAKGYTDAAEVSKLLLEPAMRNRLLADITAYRTNCENNTKALDEKAAELEGLTEPDTALFASRRAEIEGENKKYLEGKSTLEASIKRLTEKYKELATKAEHFNANIIQAQDDSAFAESLKGRSGISLERYVLGIMFDQVLGEANRMLQNMHGGRYFLERSDKAEGGGNKAGLDLLVHDNRSPESESRSVRMLSGGEKFLVSLALSIGLSTFAQKSGVRIEALFIDEGFGTLDDNSINDAMAILETVRGKSGMIGIISHVALLEGTVSTHLEVVKKESGSLIKPV